MSEMNPKYEQFLIGPISALLATGLDRSDIICPITGKRGCKYKSRFSLICPKFTKMSRRRWRKTCNVVSTADGGLRRNFEAAAAIGKIGSVFLDSAMNMLENAGTSDTPRSEYDAAFKNWQIRNGMIIKTIKTHMLKK